MKLKKILETLDGLSEAIAALYEKRDDGKFHLDIEDDDSGPLLRAKEHEKGLRILAEQKVEQLTNELNTTKTKLSEAEAALSQDTTALRSDHERTVSQLRAQHSQEKAALESTIKKIYVGDVANRIAREIAIDEGAAELLAEVMQRRLVVEMVNGEPVTRVLDANGKASNMSPDDLKTEYLQMKKYAGILRASEASGGGASGGDKKGGALKKKKLADMGDAERTQLARENPAELQRLMDEARDEGDGEG